MLHRIEGLPAGIHGFRVEGDLRVAEHEDVLRGLVAAERKRGGDVRLMYDFGDGFDGFESREPWHEMKTAWRLLHEVERCAVVAGDARVRAVTKVAGAMVPARVRVFGRGEMSEAADWLQAEPRETLSVRLLPETGTLLVQPVEAISAEDLEHLRLVTDTWIAAGGHLRALVVHAYRFPGWEDLQTALHHWSLAREKARELDRVAVAVGGPVAGFVTALGELFTEAEVRRFEPDALADAVEWAAVPTGEPIRIG